MLQIVANEQPLVKEGQKVDECGSLGLAHVTLPLAGGSAFFGPGRVELMKMKNSLRP